MAPIEYEEVAARVQISTVLTRHARGTDRRDRELLLACYHPHAREDHNIFNGTAEEFIDWMLAGDGHEWVISTHALSPPLIEFAADVAWSETTCVAHHMSPPDEVGVRRDLVIGARYEDHFALRGGEWRIAHRTVIYDWAGELLLAQGDKPGRRMPFPGSFIIGTRGADDPSWRLRGHILEEGS
jgi:hypothetical protein